MLFHWKSFGIKKVTVSCQESAYYFTYTLFNGIGSVKNEFHASITVSFWAYSENNER